MTEDSPWVKLDRDKQVFEIGGQSLPENSYEFYKPVLNWLTKYLKDPNPKTVFKFKFEYFNSITARRLVEIFSLLKQIHLNGNSIKICWYHEKENDLIKSKGYELLNLFDTPFEIIELEN